jgi:TPP-dependent trihydroxycyclohexane-1,2-dione (THcHDO) dehydratase
VGHLRPCNVAGIAQALQQQPRLRYYQARNEQAMVHAAAGATINRLPVLLLPGDIFARRNVGPVLQQLESLWSQDLSVNDCLKPASRYWDRINRPDQLSPDVVIEVNRNGKRVFGRAWGKRSLADNLPADTDTLSPC